MEDKIYLSRKEVEASALRHTLRKALSDGGKRLGLISSTNGSDLITMVLEPRQSKVELWTSKVTDSRYPALSLMLPQAHWFERLIHDIFAIIPDGHPRLKAVFTKEAFAKGMSPLVNSSSHNEEYLEKNCDSSFLNVAGEAVYEIPVGPVHAGIIEPGHFRLSVLGEIIENLELRFGYLHRGIEERLAQIAPEKGRFVAEACASDSAAAYALCNALAIESLHSLEAPARAQSLRTLALEIERAAMHTSDLSGMAQDIGYLAAASSLSRLRGTILKLAELLSRSRYLRGFICPGGVVLDPGENLSEISRILKHLQDEIIWVLDSFIENVSVIERLSGIGIVSHSLAEEFGIVGVAARASGIEYDTRVYYKQGLYPGQKELPVIVENAGDVLARTRVRARELKVSLAEITRHLAEIPDGPIWIEIPKLLPADAIGTGIVESFRGELIHLILTGEDCKIKRYIVKDPSSNNWTAMAIAARNNLIADFPLLNKSFGLSYSGHDL